MAVPKLVQDAKGLWRGKSQLNLPWLPPDKRVSESMSQLHVDTDAQDSFATITYTWEYEGKAQEGTMLVCMAKKSKEVQIGWVDSWHENSAVLHLVGTEGENGSVKTRGTYTVGKQTGGWSIAFDFAAGELTMTMENIMPGADPEWSVKAVYKRD